MINKIIQKHQKIIYLSENIKYLYLFIMNMHEILIICLLGFLVIIVSVKQTLIV